jgi:hypothetical protein
VSRQDASRIFSNCLKLDRSFGMALGYADEAAPINGRRSLRAQPDDFPSFSSFGG